MIELFVAIKGFFKIPINGETYKAQRFTFRAEDSNQAKEMINRAMMETLQTKCLITPKDDTLTTQGIDGFNNIRCWSTDLFAFFEIEVKRIAASTPTPDLAKGNVVLQ